MHGLRRGFSFCITLFVLCSFALQGLAQEVEALFQQSDLQILYGNVQRPNGMTWFANKLYVACTGDWTIYEIDLETGTTRTYIFGVQNAHSLFAEEGSGGLTQLWMADFETNDLLRIHPNAAPATISQDGLKGGWGIAHLDEDRFLISNLLDGTMVTASRSGNIETWLTGLRGPTGLVLDEGALYIANTGSARRSIEWFTLREIRAVEGPLDTDELQGRQLVSGLQNVTGLALAEDGWLYFSYSEGGLGMIGRVEASRCRENGGCLAEEVELVIRTELSAPLVGLTLAPDSRLFFHSLYQPEIYWLSLSENNNPALHDNLLGLSDN